MRKNIWKNFHYASSLQGLWRHPLKPGCKFWPNLWLGSQTEVANKTSSPVFSFLWLSDDFLQGTGHHHEWHVEREEQSAWPLCPTQAMNSGPCPESPAFMWKTNTTGSPAFPTCTGEIFQFAEPLFKKNKINNPKVGLGESHFKHIASVRAQRNNMNST